MVISVAINQVRRWREVFFILSMVIGVVMKQVRGGEKLRCFGSNTCIQSSNIVQ
jgi:hypothetical protein